MYISKFEGLFCFPAKVELGLLDDLRLEKVLFNGSTKSVLYSEFAGGIVGDQEGPFIYGTDADKLNFTFSEGSTVWVYPAHSPYVGMLSFGYKKMEQIAESDNEGVMRHHYVTFHMDSFQIVGSNDRMRDALDLTNSHPRYQSVLTKYWVNGVGGTVLGCPVWSLPHISSQLHVFRKGNANYVSSAPMAYQAEAKIRDMFGFGKGELELVTGDKVCV